MKTFFEKELKTKTDATLIIFILTAFSAIIIYTMTKNYDKAYEKGFKDGQKCLKDSVIKMVEVNNKEIVNYAKQKHLEFITKNK